MKGLDEMRALRKHFPDLWGKLQQWQRQTWRKFRSDYSAEELEAKFAEEDRKAERFKQVDLFDEQAG